MNAVRTGRFSYRHGVSNLTRGRIGLQEYRDNFHTVLMARPSQVLEPGLVQKSSAHEVFQELKYFSQNVEKYITFRKTNRTHKVVSRMMYKLLRDYNLWSLLELSV